MSDAPDAPTNGPRRATAPDEVFAEAYAQGFGDGLKDGLKELLQHASRGHTAQELRLFIESRLARVPEEMELKRRSVLAPPPKTTWGTLGRLPTPSGVPNLSSSSNLLFGSSYLVREERPLRALDLMRRAAAGYPRVVIVSLHPPNLAEIATERLEIIHLQSPSHSANSDEATLTPGEIGGRIRTATEANGGAAVYLDAVEFLVTEHGLETTLKFVNWLTAQVSRSASVLIASVDPQTLGSEVLHRLQRSFTTVQ